MNFSQCDAAYDNCGRLLACGVKGHSVDFPQLAAFDRARLQFSRLIAESPVHEMWDDGVKLFNAIHAAVARTPCRPNWLIQEFLKGRGGERIVEQLETRLSSVDPRVSTAYIDLRQRLDDLGVVEENPLLAPVRNNNDPNEVALFILRDLRLLNEVRVCLADVAGFRKWEIVKPAILRNQRQSDRLFIFGPAWYLSYRNEDYLLRAPTAGKIHLIACAHEFGGGVRSSLLSDNDIIKITGAQNVSSNQNPWDFEPISPVEVGRFRFKNSSESRIWESGKKVTAIPFRLGGSHGTFLGRDSSVWVVTQDLSQTPPVCSGVEKTPVDDIEPGDLILMTTSGGGDMIPVVADMILPRSHHIRDLQRQWKSALLARVEQEGLDLVSFQLQSLGALKASTVNLKNWCNPRSIGMENLESDLMAVMQLVEMDSRYDEVVSGIKALRGAHQSAGAKLQKKLRESLQGEDLGKVFRDGHLEIKHGDGPAKTVFLVEERGKEEEVPEEWEGELREIDD